MGNYYKWTYHIEKGKEHEVMKQNKENKENIELYSSTKIQQYKSDVAFVSLMEGVLGNLYVVPNFQRSYRWTTPQVEELAISLVRGMPIPPIYTYRNDKGQLEILDGQQRIISLLLYYMGKELRAKKNAHIDFRKTEIKKAIEDQYVLADYEYKMHYFEENENGKEVKETVVDISYKNLPEATKRKVDYTTITVVEIVIDNKKYKKQNLYKIFANLNSGGTLLTRQELRNGIYGCEFYDMLYDINERNTKWRKMFGGESKEAKDIEFLLRLCALREQVYYDTNFSVKPFKNYARLLDDFSGKVGKYTANQIEDYRQSLLKFINIYPEGSGKKLTLWESVYLVVNLFPQIEKVTAQQVYNILNNENYNATVRSGTGVKSEIEKRLKIVLDELL